MKEHKKQLILTSLITILPMIVGFLVWDRLPDTIATHFGINNEPNGWSSRFFAVVGIPLFLLAMHIFTIVVTLNDPKKRNIGDKMLLFVFWIIPITSVVVNGAVLGYALGIPVNMGMFANILVGVLFMGLGNYMSKNRQNYTVGIRLPWTLNNEENWDKTHRFASKLWVLSGILMIVNAFFQSMVVLFVAIIVSSAIPAVYSFIIYKKQQKS